ncbi:MAG: flagellin [Planctomycetota bacterium]
MARINSNIPSLIAQSNLGKANEDLGLRLERLSTGLRINRGRDDPAGLIISERLRGEIESINQAVSNADRASSVIATTESALGEVNDLLLSVQSLLVEAANTGAFSDEEVEANQQQIDSAIESITRIANTATFGGLTLLDGSLDYTLSGVIGSQLNKVSVSEASFFNQSSVSVDVDVLNSAQTAQVFFQGTPAGAGSIASSIELEIAGADGVTVLSFTSGTSLSDIVDGINNQTPFTGVEADLVNPADPNSGMVFRSTDYGSDAFVSVDRLDFVDSATTPFAIARFDDGATIPSFGPPFPWTDPNLTTVTAAGSIRDTGQDVTALINGTLGRGDGLEVSLNTNGLAMDLLLDEAFGTDPMIAASNFTVTGGGSLFQIGPDINPQQQENIGIPSVAAERLGGTLINGTLEFLVSLKSGGGNSLAEAIDRGNDFTASQDILDTAIDEVSVLRGRLGAFERNVLDPSVRSMQTAFENLSSSVSRIRDADFAAETSALTRAQILTSSSTSVLGLANQQSQTVLQLLG